VKAGSSKPSKLRFGTESTQRISNLQIFRMNSLSEYSVENRELYPMGRRRKTWRKKCVKSEIRGREVKQEGEERERGSQSPLLFSRSEVQATPTSKRLSDPTILMYLVSTS